MHTRLLALAAASMLPLSTLTAAELRVGMIGLDTSHVVAFTKLLNDPNAKGHVPGAKVVAAFKGGSPDIESSASRIDKYTAQLQQDFGVKLYDSIEEMCRHVDAVLLESVDGRPHLWQAVPVILAGKPMFIDKPMAGSLGDGIAIFKLAERHKVPVFSSSSLRYSRKAQEARSGAVGRVTLAETTSPAGLEPHHPDLFWYGIHGVETLFTVMGSGCETVERRTTEDGKIEVVGTWTGGRTGIFREAKGYTGKVKGDKGEMELGGSEGYAPLVVEIVKFFQTGKSPVPREETIEILAFMEAADESKRQGGKPVSVRDVLQRCGGK
jgi:predicted dehydrogenase